jgi:hypothetical protein
LTISIPAFAGVRSSARHFFGTRGFTARFSVTEGRAMRATGLPFGAHTLVSVKQVHGTEALVLDRDVDPGESFQDGWDALVTNRPGLIVAVRTADCVPVLLHDAARRVVAAIHAGWRGAIAGIVPRTIRLMQRRFGSDPAHLHVALGPSAGGCCYEVDEPVLAQLRGSCAAWRSFTVEVGDGKALLDLRRLLRWQTQSLDILPERIVSVNACTICHPDLFFSYRRDGVVKGTMVSGIVLRSAKN